MATAETRSHLPYAIRYAARLQERTASCLKAEGKPVEILSQEAQKLRVAAELVRQGVALSKQHYPFKGSCLCVISNWPNPIVAGISAKLKNIYGTFAGYDASIC